MGELPINYIFFFFFFLAMQHVELPQPGIEPMPAAWKHGVLTTGPAGKS